MLDANEYQIAGVSTPETCPQCGEKIAAESMEVTDLNATPKGFEVDGRARLRCSCPACGQMLAVAKQSFAVECVGVSCPNCKSTDISCELTSVRRDGVAYSFHGTILCARCSNRSAWQKVVSVLARIKRVKLQAGPLGTVEVEMQSA